MKAVIISDTHFGDPMCELVEKSSSGYKPGPRMKQLKKLLGKNTDYLILLGDIIDFSVASYEEAYTATKCFLENLPQLGKYIIYVPGNHDFDVWDTVEYQVNVINQIQDGELPRKFKWSVPAVLDDTQSNPAKGLLPTVTPRAGTGTMPYGGLFLDKLAQKSGVKNTFVFAYPNAYLRTKEGEMILITHGHYFEAYWTISYEVLKQVFGDDIKSTTNPTEPLPYPPALEDLVSINFPTCQLACSGVGQAGPLTAVIRTIIKEAKLNAPNKPLRKIREYLDRAIDVIDVMTELGDSFFAKFLDRVDLDEALLKKLSKGIIKGLQKYEPMRHRVPFLSEPDTKRRFATYIGASQMEVARLNNKYGLTLPLVPNHVIFGHTHRAKSWDPQRSSDKEYDCESRDGLIRAFNCGSWLARDVGDGFRDHSETEVFIYESATGMRSERLGRP